jgi:hypothetical protein
MQKKIGAIGLLSVGTPSIEEINGFLGSEREKWGTLLKRLGLEGTQ